MSGKFKFEELAGVALGHIRTLVTDIAPGGEMEGSEYVCASVQGGKGTSCKINTRSGRWQDFATGEKGGDLISLWAAAYGVNMGDAYRQLADHLGFAIEKKKNPPPRIATRVPEATKASDEIHDAIPYSLVPIPSTARVPTFHHYRLGAPTSTYLYKNRAGEPLFYVSRYDTKDGKEFIPSSWCQNRCEFVPKSWDAPRPLYGLDLLDFNPQAGVLIVEGEKAAEAARKLIPEKAYVVVTWSNGSKSWDKVDWSPIFGRTVLLWPDNDLKLAKTPKQAEDSGVPVGVVMPEDHQPGFKAMMGIADLLSPHCVVKYFSLAGMLGWGEIDGFDAADVEVNGTTWSEFRKIIIPRLKVYEKPKIIQPVDIVVASSHPDSGWITGSQPSFYESAGIGRNDNGKVILNMDNVKRVFEFHEKLKGKIWFDEFHTKIFTTWRTDKPVEWGPMDDMALLSVFQRFLGFHKITKSDLIMGMTGYAYDNRKNEARDWMDTLKWDGVSRVDSFLTQAFSAKDGVYVRAASGNFFKSMVARVYYPGCQADNMLILEGDQGIRKSSALRALGGNWYTESGDQVGNKDFTMLLQGKLVVEMAELSAFSNSETTAIKRMITIPSDRFRPPYASTVQEFPRTSVFVGTTNDKEYLKDFTGGRRFWPIEIYSVDMEYIVQSRDQLFAEAISRYKSGEEWWLMPELETKREQESRREKDAYESIIQDYLTGFQSQNARIPMRNVAQELGFEIQHLDMKTQRRIGKIMRILGWENLQVRVPMSEKRETVWVKKEFKDLH